MEENILNCLVLEIEAGSKSILEYLGGMFSEKVADMQTPCGALALQACYFPNTCDLEKSGIFWKNLSQHHSGS